MQEKYELSLQTCTPGPGNAVPVYVLAQVLPPSVDLKILLVSLCGKATTAFIHARDVHVACGRVAGNLHVADEAGSNPVLGPGVTVVSGDADLESTSTDIEVVPGDVHVSEVRRGGVVVSPARFPVVATAGVNAEMGPASWILRSSSTCIRPGCSFRSHPARR